MILKVKKTDGFLKVTCRKCDRGLKKRKSRQNRKGIHEFSEKVSQIADTLENLRFWTKKVSQIVRTFENLRFWTKKVGQNVRTFES